MADGYWDIHDHLLPGVDDGSCCMQETFELLQAEYEQGIRNIVFTPHFRPGMFSVPAGERESVYREVIKQAAPSFPGMEFFLGCEFFAHRNMISELKDERCRMAGTRAVLLEFSTRSDFEFVGDSINAVSSAGMLPVLAHVERYQCMYESDERIASLRGRGALIQINAGSLLGKGTRQQKHFCQMLMSQKCVDFIASDAHNPETRPVLMGKCIAAVSKKYGADVAEKIFRTNPERLFGVF